MILEKKKRIIAALNALLSADVMHMLKNDTIAPARLNFFVPIAQKKPVENVKIVKDFRKDRRN